MNDEHLVADDSLLRGFRMAATIDRMAKNTKTEQVRIPTELAENGRIIAAAKTMSLPQYVEQVLREAIIRDFPEASRTIAQRAQKARKTKVNGGKEEHE